MSRFFIRRNEALCVDSLLKDSAVMVELDVNIMSDSLHMGQTSCLIVVMWDNLSPISTDEIILVHMLSSAMCDSPI